MIHLKESGSLRIESEDIIIIRDLGSSNFQHTALAATDEKGAICGLSEDL